MPITTPEELRTHLELAIGVELSTVPPYLYAMYSIEDQSSEATLLIRSVVAEEMLHAALAANLLLAVGGNPDFTSPDLMPRYPSDLPHHKPTLTLNIKPCSEQQVKELFLVIEQPETHAAPPEDDIYTSLGQFYHAIEKGLERIAESHDIFADPQTERQMANASYYQPVEFDAEDSGGLLLIDDIESAKEAIHIIVHQGEGVSDEKWADPTHQELTHYHKFLQIADGTAPIGKVARALVNPKTEEFPPVARDVSELFNAAYRYVYITMDGIFQASGNRDALVGRLYHLMSGVLSPLAHHLMTLPIREGFVAGPTFEVYDFGDSDPWDHLTALAARVAEEIPALHTVAEAVAKL
jgi:hypothetical protein